jgi:uracil-DNA glycosylase
MVFMNKPELKPRIEESWRELLMDEFRSTYFSELRSFLVDERSRHTVYPPGSQIFAAFECAPFHKVKVVIIGQDPYHGPGQAHGLCFSVPDGVAKPPSLQNIFKEIHDDLGHEIPGKGNLSGWARQGVLLLNASLTVRANRAGSHQNKGWERFTDAVIKTLSDEKEGLVFLLWGNFAIAKASLIDQGKHHILTAAHPSPFSAHKGFFGCRHFSMTNEILQAQGKPPVDWRIE